MASIPSGPRPRGPPGWLAAGCDDDLPANSSVARRRLQPRRDRDQVLELEAGPAGGPAVPVGGQPVELLVELFLAAGLAGVRLGQERGSVVRAEVRREVLGPLERGDVERVALHRPE